ncbi:hypothetical protein CR917_07295 [Pseudomonas sp. BRM28]|nr:hypothetical protein CR917_07295 [Pseudomonas sp. BRM28]
MRHIEIRARHQLRSSLQLLVKLSPITTSTTPHSCYQSLAKSLLCACTPCSGLMKPDTHLGGNARHREGSDDQATSYLYP